MATLDLSAYLTISEILRREDPDGRLAEIVDVLSEENHILDYITWIQCNNGVYHEDTRAVSEPSGAERAYDEGIAAEAGITEKVTEPTCILSGLSEVDVKKARNAPEGEGAFRNQEDSFFLKGMTKTLVSRLFDGNRETDSRQITGINNRTDYNTLSSDYTFDNANGNASATVNKTSVYFIQFGMKKVNLTYPRGGAAMSGDGISSFPIKLEDYGKSIITQAGTSEAKKLPAYPTWFDVDFGIFIHDPRCIKRVVNISTSNIDGVDDFAWHEDPMIDAYNQLEYGGEGVVILCNRTIFAQAMKRANEKGNAYFTMDTEGEGPFAKPVVRFQGIAMVRTDKITNVQATIT